MMKLVLTGLRALGRGALLFGLWMLLVDDPGWPEMLVGGVCAAVSAVYGAVVMAHRSQRPRLSLAMVRSIHRPFVLLFTDTVRVAWVLIRHLLGQRAHGHLRAASYRATEETPDHDARRILTEWSASLGANRYAIGIDRDDGYLLIHELMLRSGPLDPLELG